MASLSDYATRQRTKLECYRDALRHLADAQRALSAAGDVEQTDAGRDVWDGAHEAVQRVCDGLRPAGFRQLSAAEQEEVRADEARRNA